MSEKLCNTGDNKAAVAGDEDRLSALPEDLIRLLLSFLPSHHAVQTCVLATRWRNLWKSVPSLRIDMMLDDIPDDSANFVNSLLRYRGEQTPLHQCECEILLSENHDRDDSHRDAERWLRYAVSCKARVLRFHIFTPERLKLSAGALVSKHLTSLSLRRVDVEDFSLDVLGCQTLEVLEMHQCAIHIETEFPKSLRLLRIKEARFLPKDTRSFISAPGLVTLEIEECWGWTPLLKRLPSLVTAFIKIGYFSMDSCRNGSRWDCGNESCVKCYGVGDCVLLKGLAGATNLELLSYASMIFRKEIKLGPMFSMLKTLLLGDWCMTANFSGLVYFLQHSPVLKMLTLQLGVLYDESSYIKTSVVYKPKEQFLVSKHLKAVEITYFKEDARDERIHQILNVLAYHGVHPELINRIEIKGYTLHAYMNCFSFEYKN